MIRDAASAVAAAICWAARWQGQGKQFAAPANLRHPEPCGWCDYPAEDLLRMVSDFNHADVDGRLSDSFRRLTPNAQRSLVDAALYPVPA